MRYASTQTRCLGPISASLAALARYFKTLIAIHKRLVWFVRHAVPYKHHGSNGTCDEKILNAMEIISIYVFAVDIV
jgi:hypothetical protein